MTACVAVSWFLVGDRNGSHHAAKFCVSCCHSLLLSPSGAAPVSRRQLRWTRPALRRPPAFPASHPAARALRAKCAAQASGEGDLGKKRDVWENAHQATESDALYSVGSSQTPLSTFHTGLLDGQLDLFPEYQRAYVWEPDKASRLIVTLLLNKVVLPVVLHEKTKGTFDVVDGKQRLTTMLRFLMCGQTLGLADDREDAAKLMSVFQDLKYLVKLDESNEQLNGLCFSDLSDSRQRAYKSFKIT